MLGSADIGAKALKKLYGPLVFLGYEIRLKSIRLCENAGESECGNLCVMFGVAIWVPRPWFRAPVDDQTRTRTGVFPNDAWLRVGLLRDVVLVSVVVDAANDVVTVVLLHPAEKLVIVHEEHPRPLLGEASPCWIILAHQVVKSD